jgi:hypothetical protein
VTDHARMRPTFVVAGAARAGSTAVVEGLRAHPDVFVTQPKEPHFLALGGEPAHFTGPGDDVTINRVAVCDRDAYLALYPEDGPFLALGEGSVSTLYYPATSIPAVQSLNPDLRLVVILREPVDRAFSSYQYLRVRGFEPCDDFLTAVEDEPRRIEQGWHHLWHYTGMSRYAEPLSQFLAAFGEQVGVWFYDDLDRDPSGTLSAIQRFVGVDPARSPVSEAQRVNASGRPKRQALHQAIQWASRHPAVRDTVKRAVPFSVRERIRSSNLQPQGVSDEVRAHLAPRFVEDLERLEELLGRPVPESWTNRVPDREG